MIARTLVSALALLALSFGLVGCEDEHDHSNETPEEHAAHAHEHDH